MCTRLGLAKHAMNGTWDTQTGGWTERTGCISVFFSPFSHGVVVRGRIGWVGSFSYPRFGVLLLLFSLLFRWTGHLSPTARVRSCIRFGLLLFHFHISTHTPCRLWFVP